jgi:phospholipid-transporting ATPase
VSTSNEVHTSKYTWYTFVPLNLYEQFHNRANVYFLFVAVLQMVPSISITSGRPLLLMPLGFVLLVGAARDLFEDEKRKAADRAENEREVLQFSNESGALSTIKWRTVRPGHILRIRRGELVPADAVLIGSSAPHNGCAVETANLDGETDHKPKATALPQASSWEAAKEYRLEFEPPSADLYEFKGAFLKEGDPRVGVGINSLLLRGCTLQQVDWADCLVCYCGHETRVYKNQQRARFKASQLDTEMNAVIMVIFVVQLLLCTAFGISYALWEKQHFNELWYLMPGSDDENHHAGLVLSAVEKALTWLLQLNNMVPISLMVMMTTVKFLQGKLLQCDNACFDAARGKPAEVHTCQVLESLGQVTHIFSDKTGTLTCNQMVYKACAIDGEVYGVSDKANASEENLSGAPRSHVDFAGRAALLRDLEKAIAAGDKSRQAILANFLLCQALCHTVSIQGDSPDDARPSGAPPIYVASSPDELALVWAAYDVGLAYQGQLVKTISLEIREDKLLAPLAAACGSDSTTMSSKPLEVELLEVCEFDNVRKRMTVVVRYPNGRKMMLMKGADSSVLPSLTPNQQQQSEAQLDQFATTGLRTLCLAYRELSEAEHAAWSAEYAAAMASISEDKAEKVYDLACKLETAPGLVLLGVTAIEDRLQDGVPQTLEFIRHAGITVWVLTGDKLETAISVGRSCRLLTKRMTNTQLSTWSDVTDALMNHESGRTGASDRAITITGAALGEILRSDPNLKRRFYSMARGCKTVICCRVSPKQKADVVEIVKELHELEAGQKPVTLAIGDGANDVAMIMAAHVGVGLSGKEGAQAARTADFAMGQFQFLRRLIFVHGRESYRRNSILVSYNFYKNMVLCLPPAFICPFMAFSGQPFYEQVLYQFYNVAFTFWPCVFFALFDRPVQNLKELEQDVEWYTPALQKQFFGLVVFIRWIVAAILQGAFIPWVAFLAFGASGKPNNDAPSAADSLWLSGTATFFWVVLGVNLTLLLRLTSVIAINVGMIVFSVLCFPAAVFVLGMLGNPYLRGIFDMLFGGHSLRFLLATLLVVVCFLGLGEPFIARATPGGSRPPRSGERKLGRDASTSYSESLQM